MMSKKQQRLANLAYKVVDGEIKFEEYRRAEQKYIKKAQQ